MKIGHPAALLLPEQRPGQSWWRAVYKLAAEQDLQLDTFVRDYAELMSLIWGAATVEIGIVPSRAMLPPEPIIAVDDPPPMTSRPKWVRRSL